MAILAGNAFLIPSGPQDYLHLHIVCSHGGGVPDQRVLVSISSIKDGKFFDPTCIVEAGEHTFVNKKSFVEYRHTQERSALKIVACINNGGYVPKADISPDLLERVIKGFYKSDFTAPWVLSLLGG